MSRGIKGGVDRSDMSDWKSDASAALLPDDSDIQVRSVTAEAAVVLVRLILHYNSLI